LPASRGPATTEPLSQPVFFVVDEDPSAVEMLVGDLERCFRADYRVMGETSAQAALEQRSGNPATANCCPATPD
jgi:hypothetical protein